MTITNEPTTAGAERLLTAAEWRHAAALLDDRVREGLENTEHAMAGGATLVSYWEVDDVGAEAQAIGRARKALAALKLDQDRVEDVAESVGLDRFEPMAWALAHRVLSDLGMLDRDSLERLLAMEVQQ